MEEFIHMNQEQYPELVNFMGFADEQELESMQTDGNDDDRLMK